MPYPTVPDLKPFEGNQRPSLLAGGPYDEQLTAIETYLAQLGSYIDGTVLAAAQAAQATANANAAAIGDWATDHPDTTISQAVTATNESVSELGDRLDTTTQTANTAAADSSAALSWTRNASAVSANVPTKINSTGNGTDTVAAQLFGSDGTEGTLLDKLALLLSNLMLAAPNGDTTKLLGYLADNSADLTTATARPRSSSALTWASEQGGYEGNVYNVPVAIDASGLVRLDVEGEFAIHAGETLFVVQSEYESFAEGSLLGYSGAGATLGNDGVNIVGDLLTLFEPTSGGGGSLSLSANNVLLNGGSPVSTLVISEEDTESPQAYFVVSTDRASAFASVQSEYSSVAIQADNTAGPGADAYVGMNGSEGNLRFTPTNSRVPLTAGDLADAEFIPVGGASPGRLGVIRMP